MHENLFLEYVKHNVYKEFKINPTKIIIIKSTLPINI